MTRKLLHVVALGCPKNRVDTETVVARATAEGYTLTDDPRAAEVILVTTCGFISEAAQESVTTALELSQARGDDARLVVAGCLSQRYGDELAQALPEADAIIGTGDLEKIVAAIVGRGPRVAVGEAASDISPPVGRRPSGKPGSAYLKVSDGCSRRCAFCTIPQIRGPYRSRPLDEICDEARDLVHLGVKEINLVAQDLSSFGRDRSDSRELAELLLALDQIEGLRWIRPLYLYPEKNLHRVLKIMAQSRRVVPYLDLPIQHASEKLLKRMKRGHRPELLRKILNDSRDMIPGVSLRTTVIVGHPGETEEDFAELLAFMREVRFENLGAFRYSPEEGTASYEQRDIVSSRDSYNRYRKVMAVQRRISREICRSFLGRTLEVLVEGPSDDSSMVYAGRHAGQAPEVDGLVYLDQPVEPGSMVRVMIKKSGDYDLFGEVLGEAE